MNYPKVKLIESLITHFKDMNITNEYKREIEDELMHGDYFEKNCYAVLRYVDLKKIVSKNINDYSDFKSYYMTKLTEDVPFDMLYALHTNNKFELIDNELKLDIDEVKTALIIEMFGVESKSIIGIDIDKVEHVTKLYDVDGDGKINETEYKLSKLRIDFDDGDLKQINPQQKQVEYQELEL